MATKLSSEQVTKIFSDSLFREGEDTSKHIAAHGIRTNVGFHPERLESHRSEVESMLYDLPKEFMQSSGEGWSFLNACNDKEGKQWTGLHIVMEQLILLGIALSKVEFLPPRELWKALPGGMPYFVVLDSPKKVEK